MTGNSSRRSYRFTTPNFFTVWAGAPSSQWGRTLWPVSQTPCSKISRQVARYSSSALLIGESLLCLVPCPYSTTLAGSLATPKSRGFDENGLSHINTVQGAIPAPCRCVIENWWCWSVPCPGQWRRSPLRRGDFPGWFAAVGCSAPASSGTRRRCTSRFSHWR